MATPLDVAVDRYIVYVASEQRRSANTVRAYTKDLATFTEYAAAHGVRTLEAVDHTVGRAWLVEQVRSGLSRRTVARRTSAVRGLFTWAQLRGLISANPIAGLAVPKLDQHLPKVPSQKATNAALDKLREQVRQAPAKETSATTLRDSAMVELLYATGMRVAELVQLDCTDLHTENNTVRVIGKGNKERLVPYGELAAVALEDYSQYGRPQLVQTGSDSAYFLGVRGGRVNQRQVRKVVNKYLDFANSGQIISPHGLRHAAATHMLDGGADLRYVSEQLGHVTLGSTQIYTHVSVQRLRVTYDESHPRA